MTHRFNGIPINLDSLNRNEVLALNVYAHQRMGQAIGEVALLGQFLRQHGYYGLREVPEFGSPMTSVEPDLAFEHDPFGDIPCQQPLPGFPEGA